MRIEEKCGFSFKYALFGEKNTIFAPKRAELK